MRPPDIAFNIWIAGGVDVDATTGIEVEPIDTGLGNYRVVLIPNDHFRIAFDRVILGTAIAHALFLVQMYSNLEDRFDFLVIKTGAGFLSVLGT